jgi:hypothetical protein
MQNATRSSSTPPSGWRVGEPVRGQEDLLDRGAGLVGGLAQSVGVHRHVPPAEHLAPLDQRVLAEDLDRAGLCLGVLGQEDQAGGVGTGGRQREVGDRPVEGVRNLDHDARAVAGVVLGAAGAPVVEADQRRQAFGDHIVAATAVQVGHEGDTAGVALLPRVVQTAVARRVVRRGQDRCAVLARGLRRGQMQPLGVRNSHRASCRHWCYVSRSGRRRPCKVSRVYVNGYRSPPVRMDHTCTGANRGVPGESGSQSAPVIG